MSTTSESINNRMTIAGKEVNVVDCWLTQSELKFYPENPRIYSIVYCDSQEPSQEEIEEKLTSRDHVKQLYQSIRANDGLIDPLIVLAGQNIVLEGNSRLAAYRLLAKEDAIKWGKVWCRVLPGDIEEKLIFNLLGQYHIIGRQDWAPFEQAGYLWRRKEHYGASTQEMSKEMGIPESRVRFLIKVYSFMYDNDDVDVQHWSYYDELLKIPSSKKKKFPTFDKTIVKKIKSGEIAKAVDIRDKVKKIVNVPGKNGNKLVAKFLENKNTLERCYESAIARGAGNGMLIKLSAFKEYISDIDIESVLKEMEDAQKKKCLYELKKISQAANNLMKCAK